MKPNSGTLTSWQPRTLGIAGAGLATIANDVHAEADKMFNGVHELWNNGSWRGKAQAAAERQADTERVKARKLTSTLDNLAKMLVEGMWALQSAKDHLMSLVGSAADSGLAVADNWSVSVLSGRRSASDSAELASIRETLQRSINDALRLLDQTDRELARRIREELATDTISLAESVAQQKRWDAVEATTVASIADSANESGEPTKTVTMLDGSRQVFTQSVAYSNGDPDVVPAMKVVSYDKEGAWLSSSKQFTQRDGVTRIDTDFAKGGSVWVRAFPNGRQVAQVNVPGKGSKEVVGEFFTHSYLTAAGSGNTAVDQATTKALEGKVPVKTPFTIVGDAEQDLKGLRAGARFAGPALTVVGGLLDVASGTSLGKAAAETGATLVGSWIGGTLGALVPVPYLDIVTAAGGSAAGGWVANWLVDQAF